MRIDLERTRSGLPALWERGGGFSNTGRATVVAGRNGGPKRPVYVRRKGHLACAEHALFVLHPGDYIVRAGHHRWDFTVEVHRVLRIGEEDGRLFAETELVARYEAGEWNPPLPPRLEEAVKAARQKATCYHCREPHYALLK